MRNKLNAMNVKIIIILIKNYLNVNLIPLIVQNYVNIVLKKQIRILLKAVNVKLDMLLIY